MVLINNLEDDVVSVGNRGKFQQVLMNIISNSKDAILDCENKSIEILVDKKGDMLEVSIKDNGHGIPKDLQEKIFDPFFTTKEINKGTGIGLSLVYNFIKDMNGTIRIVSEEEGATFIIEIPVTIASLGKTEIQAVTPVKYRANAILADDEEGIRVLLTDLLEDMGLEVTAVENGNEAFKLYCENPGKFDLIISDMKMPEMDGPALLKAIRSRVDMDQPKFIFVTGGINLNFEDTESEINNLIDGYFYKPFDEITILKTLSAILSENTTKAV
jgi:CheY-like chemotaxis protein